MGVIGAGAFAEQGHIPGLQSHAKAEVVALCGPRPGHVKAMADRFGVASTYTDYRELCRREDIDAVTIASPDVFHCEQALFAFAQGKHVFCEKPLGMSVAEAGEMLEAAEASGRVHAVGFTFRFNFGVAELKRRLAAGDIGDPHYLRIQYDRWEGLEEDWQAGWREKQATACGGMLGHYGPHLFDIARYILGPLDRVTGFCVNLPRERRDRRTGALTPVETDDVCASWFEFSNGVRGQWFASRATPPFGELGYVEVIGSKGALKAALSRGRIDRLRRSTPKEPEWVDLPLPPGASDDEPHALSRMMKSFVEACLRGRLDPSIDASFRDGFVAQQGLAAVASGSSGRGWVKVDDDRA